jgi:hypothetical protein
VKHWKDILAAALIFASGFVTGALAFRAIVRPHAKGPPPTPMDLRYEALQKMKADLQLSPVQADRIEAIIQEGRKRLHLVWETTCQPRVREEMKKIHERIHSELTPEQCSRYDDLYRRAKERLGFRSDFSTNRGAKGSPPSVASPSEGPEL